MMPITLLHVFRKWFPCPNGAMIIKKNEGDMVNAAFYESDWTE